MPYKNISNTRELQIFNYKNENLESEAREIANVILNSQNDSRLTWRDNSTVRILMGKIIPDKGDMPKQAVSVRRQNFRSKIEKILFENGFKKVRTNLYTKSDKYRIY